MDLNSLNINELRDQLFFLMDNVILHLKTEPDVDKFLDETDLFDDWEHALPDAEFPIFVMAVLNNTRRDSIIDTILKSILDMKPVSIQSNSNPSKKKSIRSHVGEHPFN